MQSKRKKADHGKGVAHIFEALTLIWVCASVFLLISVYSFNPQDVSWSHSADLSTVSNVGGQIGAWLSDFILYMTGYMGYLIPVLSCLFSFKLLFSLYGQRSGEKTLYKQLLSYLSIGLIFISIFVLVSLHALRHELLLPYTAGGVFGDYLGFNMVNLLGNMGANLVSVVILMLSISWLTGTSWLCMCDKLGGIFWQGIDCSWGKIKPKPKPQASRDHTSSEAPIRRHVASVVDTDETLPISPSPRPEKKQDSAVRSPLKSSKQVCQIKLPSIELLDRISKKSKKLISNEEIAEKSRLIESNLGDFGVTVKVVAVYPGPVVTRYEIELAAGTKASKLTGLSTDLARSLSVSSVRVVEVIPGKPYVGIELPNPQREMVSMKELVSSKQFKQPTSPTTIILGKDIAGNPVVVDLAKMPHLLVAGTTGSGKSVGINAMLISMIYKSQPKYLRLIMIDPKMLELSVYEGLPHLLTPVVTDMKQAAGALRWCVMEMERRYKLMAALGVRNLAGYNEKVESAIAKDSPILDPLWQADSGQEQQPLDTVPLIVIVIDEFSDLILSVGKKVEEFVVRIAQKARACGIHLVVATQRPSVDVITGLIKANIPTRISFQVSSKVDSRTILDQQGAEQLLGHGDMLYLAPGTGIPVRVHGVYVSDQEVHRVVGEMKKAGKPNYVSGVLETGIDDSSGKSSSGDQGGNAEQDVLYDQAVQIVLDTQRASISNVQRRLKIGYNRAARIVDAMEEAGVVGGMGPTGSREILTCNN